MLVRAFCVRVVLVRVRRRSGPPRARRLTWWRPQAVAEGVVRLYILQVSLRRVRGVCVSEMGVRAVPDRGMGAKCMFDFPPARRSICPRRRRLIPPLSASLPRSLGTRAHTLQRRMDD